MYPHSGLVGDTVERGRQGHQPEQRKPPGDGPREARGSGAWACIGLQVSLELRGKGGLPAFPPSLNPEDGREGSYFQVLYKCPSGPAVCGAVSHARREPAGTSTAPALAASGLGRETGQETAAQPSAIILSQEEGWGRGCERGGR